MPFKLFDCSSFCLVYFMCNFFSRSLVAEFYKQSPLFRSLKQCCLSCRNLGSALIVHFRYHWKQVLVNSRTAIAGAIIGLLLVFLQFKDFELYWCAVFFLRCVHTFFNDFDRSKRDKQVKPSGH